MIGKWKILTTCESLLAKIYFYHRAVEAVMLSNVHMDLNEQDFGASLTTASGWNSSPYLSKEPLPNSFNPVNILWILLDSTRLSTCSWVAGLHPWFVAVEEPDLINCAFYLSISIFPLCKYTNIFHGLHLNGRVPYGKCHYSAKIHEKKSEKNYLVNYESAFLT